MKTKPSYIFLALALALALVAGSLPQRAQAAAPAASDVSCSTYHIVKPEQTTGLIARKYGLPWKDIADANNLSEPYVLKVGQKLCIPATEEETTTTTKYTPNFSVLIVNGKVFITTKDVKPVRVFRVKVRNVEVGIGGWQTLGTVKLQKKTTSTFVYNLPTKLKGIRYLNVCLKDMTSDVLYCKVASPQ